MAKLTRNEFIRRAETELNRVWELCSAERVAKSAIPSEVHEAVRRSINSNTITYRYVLPTQVLAKVVDEDLDSRSIQAGSGLAGAFDARSLCHAVIVPFDKLNHSVLGGSSEPYLNNPLRVPCITNAQRGAQKNKTGFDDLCSVLEFLEQNAKSAGKLLEYVLAEVRVRLDLVRIVYPVPNRISQQQTHSVVRVYLSGRTGGVRLQAVSVGLFRTIGHRFGMYEQVISASVNAADASTGSAADLTCLNNSGEVVLAAEVKDRELRLTHVQDKLPAIREQGIRELLFIGTQGVAPSDADSLNETLDREFASGQNLYLVPFDNFLASCLVLFGETGRREFLINVGAALDEIKADLMHRQTWRDLLEKS